MLGELLRLWRNVENVGVRDLAAAIGISAATVSRIERGYPMDLQTWLKVQDWLLKDR